MCTVALFMLAFLSAAPSLAERHAVVVGGVLTLCLGLFMFRWVVFRLKLYACPFWTGFLVIKDNLWSFLQNQVSVYIQLFTKTHSVYSCAQAYLVADH